MTTALEKALQIAGMDPLPINAREQIEELKDEIHPFEYEWVMEKLVLNEFEQGQIEEGDEIIGGPLA